MWRHVGLVRNIVSEEHIASFFRVERISKLGTALAVQFLVTANAEPSLLSLSNLKMKAACLSEILVLTRATWCPIPEDGILHSCHCENLKSYRNYSTPTRRHY
jgi:hypothetical protein